MQKTGQRDLVFVLLQVGVHCPCTAMSELCAVAVLSVGNTLSPCQNRLAGTAQAQLENQHLPRASFALAAAAHPSGHSCFTPLPAATGEAKEVDGEGRQMKS